MWLLRFSRACLARRSDGQALASDSPVRRTVDRVAQARCETSNRRQRRCNREAGFRRLLVDNKVCAIDETWTGLRLVWRVGYRNQPGPS